MPLKPTMSKEQVLEAFMQDLPSPEKARENLLLLRDPQKERPPWYYPAKSIFKQPNGKEGGWYADVLPQLMVEVGWFDKLEDAEDFAKKVRKASKNAGIQIIAKGRLTMNKEEVVSAFKKEFILLEEVKKDILVLKCPQGRPCPWYQPALSAFKKKNGKLGGWYKDVLPQIMVESGWFDKLEDAEEFAGKVGKAVKKAQNQALSKTKRTMNREDVVSAFKKGFTSLEEVKKDLLVLQSPVRYLWYSPARSVFKKSNGKEGTWYGDILPQILVAVGWFAKLEDAKDFAEKVKKASMDTRIEGMAEIRRTMNREKLISAFKEEFKSLEEAEKDLLALRYKPPKKRPWCGTAMNTFKQPNGKGGRWYKDVLPQIMVEAGWFAKLEDAEDFAEKVREASKKMMGQEISKKRPTMSKWEVVSAFKKEFTSLDKVRKNILVLRKPKGKECPWYHPSLTAFKKPDGRIGSWYKDILPQIMVEAGWFAKLEDAEDFAEKVRWTLERDGARLRAKKLRKMDRKEVISAFKKEFPSLEEAEKDLLTLRRPESRICPWYNSSLSIFKKRNGKVGRWYKDILPQIMVAVGWFDKLEDAEDFAKKVKGASMEEWRRNLSKAKTAMDKEEVISAFKREFPSLEKVRKNILVLRLRDNKTCPWYQPALCAFRAWDGKQGGWYADALPQLMVEVGWFDKLEDAEDFAKNVKDVSLGKGAEKLLGAQISTPLYPRKRENAVKKQKREYAIVVGSLKGAAKGISFEGMNPLLSLDSTETAAPSEGGIPCAVLKPPEKSPGELTPAELLRLKIHTKDWSGEVADNYADAFSHIGPYLTTRLLLVHTFELVKKKAISPLSRGASIMSGPGEVHGALKSLRAELEKHGLKIPFLVDVDMEKDMLSKSKNPGKARANAVQMPLKSRSLDFVECSSLYQFEHRRFPTIVRDTLVEAARVLGMGGMLMLTATAKRFSKEFEDGLRMLGFSIVTPANTRIMLTDEMKERVLDNLGPDLLSKAERATSGTHYLVAIKIGETLEVPPAEHFRFERVKQELPGEAKSLAMQSRKLDADIKEADDAAVSNAERIARTLEGLSPETHWKHAELIQTITSKYLLDPKPERPKNGRAADLMENANKLVERTERIGFRDHSDRYFKLVRRMAKTHRARLKEAKDSKAERLAGPAQKA